MLRPKLAWRIAAAVAAIGIVPWLIPRDWRDWATAGIVIWFGLYTNGRAIEADGPVLIERGIFGRGRQVRLDQLTEVRLHWEVWGWRLPPVRVFRLIDGNQDFELNLWWWSGWPQLMAALVRYATTPGPTSPLWVPEVDEKTRRRLEPYVRLVLADPSVSGGTSARSAGGPASGTAQSPQ